MLLYLIRNQVLHIILFQAVLLSIVLSNAWFLYRSRRHPAPGAFPKVSVLVPARNEEKTIRACIQSLLAQDYPAFEVLVLDDQSDDATRSILNGIAGEHPGLKVLSGSPAPEGLLGKNWACVQLADKAQGELLFFTDADTLHQPHTLNAVVTALIAEQADLLTGFPRQVMGSWGERLLVPFFSWALLSFVPLGLAYRLRLPALSSAVGQMMLFRRAAYQAVGGHAHLGSSIVDDLSLTRRTKAAGLRWRAVHIADLISCRMYAGSSQAFHGFAKNYFAAFDFHLLPYLFVFAWLALMFWEPIILLARRALGLTTYARLEEIVLCIALSLVLWLIPYLLLKIPPGLALFYPLTILAVEVVALRSLWLSLTGRLSWKDRSLDRPRWRWF